eukprot:3090839-Prymnesium_polylepis.1
MKRERAAHTADSEAIETVKRTQVREPQCTADASCVLTLVRQADCPSFASGATLPMSHADASACRSEALAIAHRIADLRESRRQLGLCGCPIWDFLCVPA